MINTDKAIAILRATHDGDALSPGHLFLVECAINKRLTAEGENAFDKLHDDVTSGRYTRPWMYGIEGLTREHGGAIKWKGTVVEHYSFSDADRERAAAEELAACCRSLEDRGFPVNMRTVGRYTPFADAPAETPWVQTMTASYTIFREDGRCRWLILSLPEGNAVAIAIIRSEIVLRYTLGDECNLGTYVMFHVLQGEGLQSDCKILQTYDGFVAAMEEACITPEAVQRVLAIGLPQPGTS
ncbi:MAG: hypothetical protein OEL20_04685 [Sulfuritalea sp.]|nr:hypothetical protein [Sulfuritalea sp.]